MLEIAHRIHLAADYQNNPWLVDNVFKGLDLLTHPPAKLSNAYSDQCRKKISEFNDILDHDDGTISPSLESVMHLLVGAMRRVETDPTGEKFDIEAQYKDLSKALEVSKGSNSLLLKGLIHAEIVKNRMFATNEIMSTIEEASEIAAAQEKAAETIAEAKMHFEESMRCAKSGKFEKRFAPDYLNMRLNLYQTSGFVTEDIHDFEMVTIILKDEIKNAPKNAEGKYVQSEQVGILYLSNGNALVEVAKRDKEKRLKIVMDAIEADWKAMEVLELTTDDGGDLDESKLFPDKSDIVMRFAFQVTEASAVMESVVKGELAQNVFADFKDLIDGKFGPEAAAAFEAKCTEEIFNASWVKEL